VRSGVDFCLGALEAHSAVSPCRMLWAGWRAGSRNDGRQTQVKGEGGQGCSEPFCVPGSLQIVAGGRRHDARVVRGSNRVSQIVSTPQIALHLALLACHAGPRADGRCCRSVGPWPLVRSYCSKNCCSIPYYTADLAYVKYPRGDESDSPPGSQNGSRSAAGALLPAPKLTGG